MDLLIDARGRCRQRRAAHLASAIWQRGFVHIRQERREIVVSLSPALVKGPALAAAVYAIAEINPERISLILENRDSVAVIFHSNWKDACRKLCELIAATRRTEEIPVAAFELYADSETEPEILADPEHIIENTISHHVRRDSESLTRAILEDLWEAGYDVRPHHC